MTTGLTTSDVQDLLRIARRAVRWWLFWMLLAFVLGAVLSAVLSAVVVFEDGSFILEGCLPWGACAEGVLNTLEDVRL